MTVKIKSNNIVLCPICSITDSKFFLSGRDYLSFFNQQFTLVKCNRCGLIYLNSKKELEDEQSLYQDNYYRSMKGFSRILEKLFLNERKRIVEKFKKSSGVLLDIGCGTGEFLKTMRNSGWETLGIEPSNKVKKYSTEKNKIYCEDLMNIKFGDRSFDVITLWQVLEHLNDPKNYLMEINRLLKKDGILVISVPNINSLQSKFSRNKWFHLDLPRHKLHFTPETISEILNKSNFYLKEIKHFSFECNPFGWWQSIFNLLGCEVNFVYKYLKRGSIQKEYTIAGRIYTILCVVLFGLPFLLFSFVLSFLESVLRCGGIVTVAAGKR